MQVNPVYPSIYGLEIGWGFHNQRHANPPQALKAVLI
jgi:hypothetical protein